MDADPKERLLALVDRPEGPGTLADALLWLARDAYPDLDVAASHRVLESLAETIAPAVARAPTLRSRLEALSRGLHTHGGFRGNREDYEDPKNSFLNEVLTRKVGIPITLSAVWLEVGWRLGLPLRGVSFPGHFIVRETADGSLFVDPFHGGRVLERRELPDLMRPSGGPRVVVEERFLEPVGPRAIVVRALTNLKNVYARRHDHLRALDALDQILTLAPQQFPALRDRALHLAAVGFVDAARADADRYLAESSPSAADVEALLTALADARARGSTLH